MNDSLRPCKNMITLTLQRNDKVATFSAPLYFARVLKVRPAVAAGAFSFPFFAAAVALAPADFVVAVFRAVFLAPVAAGAFFTIVVPVVVSVADPLLLAILALVAFLPRPVPAVALPLLAGFSPGLRMLLFNGEVC